MKTRDFVIVASIVLVAGFATADALRTDDEPRPVEGESRPAAATTSAADAGLLTRPRRFEPVPLEGRLVLTDSEDCRLRSITLASGSEASLPRAAGDCELWAPPVGPHAAYGLGCCFSGRFSDAVPFRLVDLNEPELRRGGYSALFGYIVWSRDGKRAAWCGESGSGFDLEIGGPARRLADCPSAFTPEGQIAFARGSELFVEDQSVLRVVGGGITFVRWGTDGSLAVVVDGRRIERRVEGRVRQTFSLPPALEGRQPTLSPDNCAALVRGAARLELLDVGCFEGEAPRTFFAGEASWSRDGEWIAVAEQQTIAFHRVVGEPEVIRWPAAAAELVWQGPRS
jgi:hypothetical protein